MGLIGNKLLKLEFGIGKNSFSLVQYLKYSIVDFNYSLADTWCLKKSVRISDLSLISGFIYDFNNMWNESFRNDMHLFRAFFLS